LPAVSAAPVQGPFSPGSPERRLARFSFRTPSPTRIPAWSILKVLRIGWPRIWVESCICAGACTAGGSAFVSADAMNPRCLVRFASTDGRRAHLFGSASPGVSRPFDSEPPSPFSLSGPGPRTRRGIRQDTWPQAQIGQWVARYRQRVYGVGGAKAQAPAASRPTCSARNSRGQGRPRLKHQEAPAALNQWRPHVRHFRGRPGLTARVRWGRLRGDQDGAPGP
jgi:hypothetical protein